MSAFQSPVHHGIPNIFYIVSSRQYNGTSGCKECIELVIMVSDSSQDNRKKPNPMKFRKLTLHQTSTMEIKQFITKYDI